jgi:glycosyltransferase involved in cell wall biosynthesis
MRIAINTRLLINGSLDGIGWFTFESVRRIVKTHPEVDFYLIFDREPHADFLFAENVTPVVLFPQARHPVLYVMFFELALPAALKKIKPDLFVSCDGYMSLRTKVPTLNVIHDLNFEEYPKHLPPLLSKYYRYFFPKFARRARRLATVSEFSKKDISKRYGVPEAKIDVVYNGVNEVFKPMGEAFIDEIRSRYSEGKPYFLFVGSIHPRKNLLNQLLAFFEFRKQTNFQFKFLIIGAEFYGGKDLKEKIADSPYVGDAIFLGRQSAEELRFLYASAFALMYVSYFEGFGIPLLEAMRSGVPAITSVTTSMPEVGGEAALYADPDSPIEIAARMKQLAQDEELRANLISAGLKRSEKFSWDKTSEDLWASIQRSIAHEDRVDSRSE